MQNVDSTTVNLSSTVELAAGKTLSGGFGGNNATGSDVSGLSTLGLTDGVTYTNLAV